ncbi:hypothetical protein CRENBAI_021383 [Crenichthys baileyi]|uniref:Uncharacterized protein n=1 Tax=Crenichthys baileyi TaxID=28760 RepID=A0AAV9SGX6_9TELE
MPRSGGKGATWVCKLAQAIRHGHLILQGSRRRRAGMVEEEEEEEEREMKIERKELKDCGGKEQRRSRRTYVPRQSSRTREDAQSKLFHSDELLVRKSNVSSGIAAKALCHEICAFASDRQLHVDVVLETESALCRHIRDWNYKRYFSQNFEIREHFSN